MNTMKTVFNGLVMMGCAVIAGLLLAYLSLVSGIVTLPEPGVVEVARKQDWISAYIGAAFLLPVSALIGYCSLKVLNDFNRNENAAEDPRAPFTNKLPKPSVRSPRVAPFCLTLLGLTMAASVGFSALSDISGSIYLAIGDGYSLGDIFYSVSMAFFVFLLIEIASILSIPKWTR
ncbi:MAG: hypothetical protein KAI85_03430 [Halopseudomonas aestusnigri]|nr:hypothetical protein [Halopseudomonas aestusnigri]